MQWNEIEIYINEEIFYYIIDHIEYNAIILSLLNGNVHRAINEAGNK